MTASCWLLSKVDVRSLVRWATGFSFQFDANVIRLQDYVLRDNAGAASDLTKTKRIMTRRAKQNNGETRDNARIVFSST